jgi:hypothetical protein
MSTMSESENSTTTDETTTTLCTICQNPLDDKSHPGYGCLRRYSCGHTFHYTCVVEKELVSCPNCRGDTIKVLCLYCHEQLDSVIYLEGEQKRLCKKCTIDYILERWTRHRNWIHMLTKNIYSFQNATANTLNNHENGVFDSTEALNILRDELRTFFSALDIMIKDNLK